MITEDDDGDWDLKSVMTAEEVEGSVVQCGTG